MRTLIMAALSALTAAACSPDEPATEPPAAGAVGAGAAETPAATDTAGAEAFLRQALAAYASPSASPVAKADEAAEADGAADAHLQRLFTPRLAGMLNRAYASDEGLDADPMCLCNDDSALALNSLKSSAQADGRVQSTVSFDSFDVTGKNHPLVLVYTLERTSAGWRIADVVSRSAGQEGYPSLLQSLSRP
jgi:hypothetical protein